MVERPSNRALIVVGNESSQLPALIANVGPEGTKRFFEFFTVPIRNAHTRAAYYRAIQQFLAWCERAGYQHLEDIEPITVAAYIEQHPGSAPTIKQHMAAIRMFFSYLTEKGILAMNPAREVKTQRFSRKEGKRRRSRGTKYDRYWTQSKPIASSITATRRYLLHLLTPAAASAP